METLKRLRITTAEHPIESNVGPYRSTALRGRAGRRPRRAVLLLVYPFIAKRLQFYRSVTKSLWFRSDQTNRTRSLIAVA